ncbi:hypothetical protein OPV22_028601 [Ensete ventricosum]|uniref:Uncharacterized protein n=1 Tax=Ensete ventricosum TaxID=4639 RepID=A0AAV8Q3I9_ENSVE|nr:hypothetical protein OPV22_028601 [Ensete ventricosum]
MIMRLKFNAKLKKLLSKRVVATLWGCIERRLNQKKATWDTGNQIALKYNEEVASIKLRATPRDEETRKLEKLRWNREWGIEANLKEGNRGIIHTESGTHFPVVVVRKGIFGEHSWNEYMDFTAKIPFVKMYEKTEEQQRGARQDDEQSFTMLEFAFIPLRAQLDLGIHETHIDNKHIAWKAIHGFTKQNMPFILGNYNTQKNKSEETQWQKPEGNRPGMLYGHNPEIYPFLPHGRYKLTVNPLQCPTILCSPIQRKKPYRKRYGYITQIRNPNWRSNALQKHTWRSYKSL